MFVISVSAIGLRFFVSLVHASCHSILLCWIPVDTTVRHRKEEHTLMTECHFSVGSNFQKRYLNRKHLMQRRDWVGDTKLKASRLWRDISVINKGSNDQLHQEENNIVVVQKLLLFNSQVRQLEPCWEFWVLNDCSWK